MRQWRPTLVHPSICSNDPADEIQRGAASVGYTTRKLTALAERMLVFLRIRKPSRRERRRALQREIHAAYLVAGADPEFHAAMREVEADFAGTLLDGLDED
jgi:hypothetical protein